MLGENELCFAIIDAFPVTEHHTLVILKRHVADYFDLHQPERNAIEALLHEQRQLILKQDNTVTGFNVGINAGASAGQTVFHVHVHLIPKRNGNVANPRGGVVGLSQVSRDINFKRYLLQLSVPRLAHQNLFEFSLLQFHLSQLL